MPLVVLCEICGNIVRTKDFGDTCSRGDTLAAKAEAKARIEMTERCSALEACVNSVGMVLISVQRSDPDHLRTTWGDEIGDLMETALKEYDGEA